jgi:hypothetical protein
VRHARNARSAGGWAKWRARDLSAALAGTISPTLAGVLGRDLRM